MIDRIKLKNYVEYKLYDSGKNLIDYGIDHNNISTDDPSTGNNGLAYILDRIFNNGDYYDPTDIVTDIKLGSSGSADSSGIGTIIGSSKTLTLGTMDISTLSAPSLTVTGTWDASDGALSGINSAALYTTSTDNMLFAFHNFSATINKTAGGTLAVNWIVSFQ